MPHKTLQIGMLLFPELTQLDLTGPYEVFSKFPQAEVHLIAASPEAVQCGGGMRILPSTSPENAPALDILFVPGGAGIQTVLEDPELLAWIGETGRKAQFVTAVCTGSLILAAAGLLDGFSATTHWLSLEILDLFPEVEVKDKRVVIDRNRITGGGVTAGIDFALHLASILYGEEKAKEIQLLIEYNPQPPFQSGHPSVAEKTLVQRVSEQRRFTQDKRKALIERIIQASGRMA